MKKSKERVKTIRYRDPYYNMLDALYSFSEQSKGDPELHKLIQQVSRKFDKVKIHLDENYIWD